MEIATQVAAGLAAVHKQNLVHRDIKPSNIMVSLEDGGAVTAKIIDLGLAKSPDEPGAQTAATKVLGARGAVLSVLVHFFENGRWGSPAKTDVEGQCLTEEDQLFILMQAGLIGGRTNSGRRAHRSCCRMSVLRGSIRVAFRRDRLLQNEHGGSDHASKRAE
jgi:serine/threonine protein kinase